MKKIILWGLTFLVILTLSSCSKNKNSKYDSVISDLRSELAVKGDSKLTFDNYEWSYKVVHNVTNADISKGDMIEVYPKKESSRFAYCLLFCSCFQDISIKYGMIVFQNLMISFSSIEYGCSCTCSCQKQDSCPKHWIRIVSGLG